MKRFAPYLLLVISAMILAGPARADSAIKTRMIQRLPVIKALKQKGVVGENNKGYLEFVGGEKEQAKIVAAENSDRGQVYETIAKQQKVSAAIVGRRRAAQLAAKAQAGEWIQDAAGKWVKK
jgi:uncharacterized protein YdbL (DUF1318 family)